MDIFLYILGGICLITGLLGAILPLPGPPLSFLGLLLLQATSKVAFDEYSLYVIGFLTVAITVLDYYIPVWGTKKFGGSKWGSYGSAAGLIVGLFLGPFGMFIGAFAGAFIGEFFNDKNQQKAFKAAIGSFLGLVAGIVLKTAFCIYMIYFAVKQFI
jgi:uncharacterized protein